MIEIELLKKIEIELIKKKLNEQDSYKYTLFISINSQSNKITDPMYIYCFEVSYHCRGEKDFKFTR